LRDWGPLATILLAFAFVSCSRVSESATATHSSGTIPGVVRVSRPDSPNTLNPLLGGLYIENYIQEAIFDGLVKLDSNGAILPDLAQAVPSLSNGGLSRDGKTITYRLRHGVVWHDGTPFTSADVVFTYKEMIDPKVPFPAASTYSDVASVSAPDQYTVVIRLKKPLAMALGQLFCDGESGQIVPKHLLDHSANMVTDPFGSHPIGTGPLQFSRWEHGTVIVLVPNPHYFLGVPQLREVDIFTIPDANTALTMARSREIDIAQLTTPSQATTLRGVPGINVIAAPAYSLTYVEFNVRHPPFDDRSVREALALAIDRPAIAQRAYAGFALAADSLIPPYSWGYAKDNGAPPYDPAAARKLLDADGFLVGPDGVRAKNGVRLEAAILVDAASASGLSGAQQVQAYWRAVGVDAAVKPMPLNVIRGPGGPAERGTFSVFYATIGFDVDPSRDTILSNESFPPNGNDLARYSTPEVERLIELGASTYDRAQRAAYYARLQRRVNYDMPDIPIAWPRFIYAVNTDLHGFAPETVNSDFWNVYDWRI
jgi:peptide/nickel transport system substrate-binding protein